jgi:plasmid stabilization system protein ParE
MTVRFTPDAQADIDRIFGYLDKRNPSAAQRVRAKLRSDAERLGAFHDLGRETNLPGVRVVVDSRFPYLVFYTVSGEDVFVLHVRHAARER